MNVLEEKNNPVMHRKEFIVEIEAEKVPSKIEAIKIISEQSKKPEENIIIERIDTNFGSKKFKINALVYEDSKSKEKYTIITRKERKKRIEEAKKLEEEKKKAEEEAKAEAKKLEEENAQKVDEVKTEEVKE